MPIFYIPTIGERIKLVQDWTFTLYDEYRNEGMIEVLGLKHDYWSRGAKNLGEVTLPAGTVLTVSRIYVRSGLKDYDSVTFIVNKKGCPDPRIANSKTGKQIRFWVKLNDINGTFFEIME